MLPTLDFIKRHKRKMVGAAVIAGALYGTKLVLESEFLSNLGRYVRGDEGAVNEAAIVSGEGDDGIFLDEARRHFLFDVHQQSCDKSLYKLAAELQVRIEAKFSIEELLTQLRNHSNLSAEQKIEIWNKLKVCSMAKTISLITIFPLVVLVLKTQKSLICQQIQQQLTRRRQDQMTSFLDRGRKLVNSWLNFEENDQTTDARLQKLFSCSLQYFQTEGMDLLFGIFEQIANDIFAGVQFSEKIGSPDMHFLLERARARIKAIGAAENFSDFVVPTPQINLTNFSREEKDKLQNLLRHFVCLMKSQQCRILFDQFSGQYITAILGNLDKFMDERGGSLPLAKLIPIICNVFPEIASAEYDSVLHQIITSVELHQFTQFVTASDPIWSNLLSAENITST